MDLTNDVYNSVNKYFSLLSHTGYKPYTEVNNLLLYCFIEELLTGPMSFFVTEEDYKSIMNTLDCLYGTCMIPYPDYKNSVTAPINSMFDEYRVSDVNILRSTQIDDLRIKS